MLKLDKAMSRRKQAEVKYAIQFAAISLFFLGKLTHSPISIVWF